MFRNPDKYISKAHKTPKKKLKGTDLYVSFHPWSLVGQTREIGLKVEKTIKVVIIIINVDRPLS